MISALIAWGLGLSNAIRYIVTRGLSGTFPPVACVSTSPSVDGSAVSLSVTIDFSYVSVSPSLDGSAIPVSEVIIC